VADSVKLTLKATDSSNKTVTTTISNVNPESTNTELMTTAQMLNALTRNVYDSTDKVETTNLDTATDKTTRTFTVSAASKSYASDFSGTDWKEMANAVIFTYSGDDNPIVPLDELKDAEFTVKIRSTNNNNEFAAFFSHSAYTEPTLPVTFTFTVPETETYTAASVTFTITA